MAAGAARSRSCRASTTVARGDGLPDGVRSVDFVGYGTGANCFEGTAPTATLSNTTAALRNGNGCTDTDSNAADFTAGAPTPRTSGESAPTRHRTSTSPATGATGVAVTRNVSVTFSEPVNVDAAVVHDLVRDERHAHATVERRPDHLHARTRDVDFAAARRAP